MVYIYEDYEVTETKQSYKCNSIDQTVRIPKSLVEKFVEEDENIEMIVICLAIIETARIVNKTSRERSQRKVIETDNFEFLFKQKLRTHSVEELIFELSEMKYHEIVEMFLEY